VNKKILIPALIVVLGVAVAVYWWPALQQQSSDGSLVLYGNVDIREVRLAFNGNEHVGEILVHEGDRVSAGQLLARLHTDRLEVERQRVSAEVTAAQAQAHSAQLSYQRIKRMAAQKLVSPDDADVAEAKSRVAAANVKAAKAVLGEVDQELKDAELYAPVGGIIRERIVEPGDFVTPQSPVLTLALTDPVWIRTYLPESFLGQVKPGAAAKITTDSFPDKSYQGWVGSISPTSEFTPKNVETPELRTRLVYQMRVYACNPEDELRLGMPATVILDPGQGQATEASPEQRCTGSNQGQSSGQP
jgi:HlyD family secretion protein